jgi:hypothetical protein
VADELGTSEGYVYKVRSNHRRSDGGETGETASGPSGDVTGMDTDITDMDPETDGETDESDPLADLVIQDEYESYECGECGAELEYLENECPKCGVEPAWWSE